MTTNRSGAIFCPSCGRETLLLRKPLYDGFTKTGEQLSCSSCGHVFENEDAVPFKVKKQQTVFSDADRSRAVQVFSEGENQSLCRYCAHYVINPFMQWCSLHKKEVAATDTCPAYEPKPEKEAEENGERGIGFTTKNARNPE